jgi:hypothetical protein
MLIIWAMGMFDSLCTLWCRPPAPKGLPAQLAPTDFLTEEISQNPSSSLHPPPIEIETHIDKLLKVNTCFAVVCMHTNAAALGSAEEMDTTVSNGATMILPTDNVSTDKLLNFDYYNAPLCQRTFRL